VKVVLLHALPLDERMWEPQLASLGAEHEVTAPRLYGLGSSMDEWAGAVLEAVDGPFAAIGASMGGHCALAIARRAPHRLLALGLVGSPAGPDPPERRPVRDHWLRRLAEDGAAALWEEMGPVFATLEGETRARAERLALEQPPEDLARALKAIRDRMGGEDLLEELPCPLLVAVGGRDPLLSVDDARVIADAAPRSRPDVFDGAGHLPSFECPAEFDDCLRAFLESVD